MSGQELTADAPAGLRPAADTESGSAPRSPTDLRAVVEWAFIGAGVAIFGFVLPHYIFGDAVDRYASVQALLDQGRLVAGPYSVVGPLFAIPLVLLGRAVGHPEGVAQLYNTALFALGLGGLYLLLRRRMPAAMLRAFLLVLITGSMFSAHVVHWNSEVFTAVALAVGLATVAVGRLAGVGWPAVVLAVANTPAAIGGLALALGRRMVEDRRIRYGLAVVAAATLVLLENWARNGHPLRSGYLDDGGVQTVMPYSGKPGFSYPIWFGLLSICLSFGKGLLFFAPGLILPVRTTMSRIALSERYSLYRLYVWWVLVVVGLILAYASWWAWYGGVTWGPRFMLFASIPAALAIAVRLGDLAVPLWVRGLTLIVAALSTWVGICGAVFLNAAFLPVCTVDNYAYESLCQYTPDFSVLWYPFVAGFTLDLRSGAVLGYFVAAFALLAWPLARSIGSDLIRSLRGAGLVRGWRW
jgi:hypothetical protein